MIESEKTLKHIKIVKGGRIAVDDLMGRTENTQSSGKQMIVKITCHNLWQTVYRWVKLSTIFVVIGNPWMCSRARLGLILRII